MEPFNIIEKAEDATSSGPHHLFDNVVELTSAKTADHDLQYVVALREANPGVYYLVQKSQNLP
jgi:transitional endoplasmic reticulum ATPase